MSQKLGSSLLKQASERQISSLRWAPGAAFQNPWKPDPPCPSGFLPYDLVMGGISCAGSRQEFIFLGFKITAEDDCSLEIKRCLLFEGRIMTNVCSILKSRDINLLTLVHIVKAMVFPVAMYGCESWTMKKTEYWRTDAFKLCCWRSLLRAPWAGKRSNQSIPQETNLKYLWKGWC